MFKFVIIKLVLSTLISFGMKCNFNCTLNFSFEARALLAKYALEREYAITNKLYLDSAIYGYVSSTI